jgi:hypothetical protein
MFMKEYGIISYGGELKMLDKNFAVIDHALNEYSKYCASTAVAFQKYRNLIHAPGFTGCMVNHQMKTVFMHIDKCASRSVTAALRSVGFTLISQETDFKLQDDYIIFAVIRDPMDRWAAGLNEYMYRFIGPECTEENPMFGISIPADMVLSLEQIEEEVKNKKFIFEEHTAPQHLFLLSCEDKKIQMFDMRGDLEKKLKNFLRVDIKLPHYNNSEKKLPNYKSFCKRLFDDYVKHSEDFFTIYKKDFELYNHCKE